MSLRLTAPQTPFLKQPLAELCTHCKSNRKIQAGAHESWSCELKSHDGHSLNIWNDSTFHLITDKFLNFHAPTYWEISINGVWLNCSSSNSSVMWERTSDLTSTSWHKAVTCSVVVSQYHHSERWSSWLFNCMSLGAFAWLCSNTWSGTMWTADSDYWLLVVSQLIPCLSVCFSAWSEGLPCFTLSLILNFGWNSPMAERHTALF